MPRLIHSTYFSISLSPALFLLPHTAFYAMYYTTRPEERLMYFIYSSYSDID